MKLKRNSFTLFAGLVAVVMHVASAAPTGVPVDRDFGRVTAENYAERTITIKPETKWVNVTQDETVGFIDASTGRSFAWTFDTIVRVFGLSAVAPDGILSGHRVDAYVAVNPRKSNNI
jgi:hypothetical protein